MSHLRLLTYNIRGGRGLNGRRDYARIRHVLDRLDIDIAVLQEVDMRPSRGRHPSQLQELVGEHRPHRLQGESLLEDGGWYGNLIASRFPIRRGVVHNLETGVDLEPRNAVDALIESPHGLLRVIGTHLSLSYLERHSEARNLLRLMKAVDAEETAPLFLLGDINEWQWRSKLLRFLDDAMTALPCAATFPSIAPIFRLDRAWCDNTDAVRIHAHRLAGRGMRLMSDHLPVVVDVEFREDVSMRP